MDLRGQAEAEAAKLAEEEAREEEKRAFLIGERLFAESLAAERVKARERTAASDALSRIVDRRITAPRWRFHGRERLNAHRPTIEGNVWRVRVEDFYFFACVKLVTDWGVERAQVRLEVARADRPDDRVPFERITDLNKLEVPE